MNNPVPQTINISPWNLRMCRLKFFIDTIYQLAHLTEIEYACLVL